MKILVTFAVEQEFAPWRRVRQFRRVQERGISVFRTQIGDVEVCVGLTGIGPLHAGRVTRLLFEHWPDADACISTGLAGGVNPEHRPGKILAARAVRAADDPRLLKSDDHLRRIAAVCGARAVDVFYTSDRVVLTAREKAALSLVADAVEMESFAVLNEAKLWRVPALAVRAISDPAGVDLSVDFNRAIGPQGRLSVRRVLGQVARHPQRLPGLIRLGTESRRAARALAAFLDAYVQALAEHKKADSMFLQVAVGSVSSGAE